MEIRRIRDEAELQAALDLRETVFCGEQGVTAEGDRDGRDHDAVQLVAVEEEGAVVGTCRVLIEHGNARFGRLAVRQDRRGAGLGTALLEAAEREARAAGAQRIGLAAQTRAVRLYARAGFTPYGDVYLDEGIEHRNMEKALA